MGDYRREQIAHVKATDKSLPPELIAYIQRLIWVLGTASIGAGKQSVASHSRPVPLPVFEQLLTRRYFMVPREECKFRKGDKVKFVPKVAIYTPNELSLRQHVGVVLDESDLPNVQMGRFAFGSKFILTADQRDLVLA